MHTPLRFHPEKRSRRNGFSLIEIMIVVAVVGLLATFSGPLLRSVGAASNLGTAGAEAAAAFDHARKNALSKNRPTAFAIVTESGSEPDAAYRDYALFDFDSETGTWTQIVRWHSLPKGISFDEKTPATGQVGFFETPGRVLTPPLTASPTLKLHGKTVSVATQVFLPSGQIYGQTVPVLCRVIDAQAAKAGRSDYYNIVLNQDTGRAKIERP